MKQENRDKEPPIVSTGSVSSGNADASLRKLLPLAWPIFTALWLVFPVGNVVEMVRSDPGPIPLVAFLMSMAAFVAVFLWLMLGYPFRGWELSSSGLRTRVGLLAALAALTLYLELGYGSGIPYHFMFVVLAAAVTLPTLLASGAVLATTLVVDALYVIRAGWEPLVSTWESAVAPFLIVGLSMIIVSRLVVTVRELQAAREEITRLAVAEERLRFARDLHDVLGHSLSLITLKSTLASRILPVTPETERAAKEVTDIEEVARGALREVRETVAGYRQPTLDAELASAQDMLDAAGIDCHVERVATDLSPQTDAVLAWTVREGATNVIRHSQAQHCEIRVHQTGGETYVEMSDDGVGASPSSNEDSNGANGFPVASGLSGLAERVAASGGAFEAGAPTSSPDDQGPPRSGFRVRVSLPPRDTTAPFDTVGEADGAANSEDNGKTQ